MIRPLTLGIGLVLASSFAAAATDRASDIDFSPNDFADDPWLLGRGLEGYLDERLLATIVGFASPDVCYPALEEADADGNRILTQEEYVEYVKLMDSTGLFDDFETYAELPFALRTNYVFLECLCQDDLSSTSCCAETGISTGGAYEGDETDPNETSYLFVVCSRTVTFINRILASEPPSVAPTDGPTAGPTGAPTAGPTVAPTQSPTAAPTGAPTSAPTPSPTPEPTDSPTAAPTISPSEAPVTPAPTEPGDTPSPTDAPTTAAPTTLSPTDEPTTGAPTATPIVVEETVSIEYLIAGDAENGQDVYIPQLIDAMDSLAPEVLSSLSRRLLRKGRRLQTLDIPTSIESVEIVECPDVIPVAETCGDVSASATLLFQVDAGTDIDDVKEEFIAALNEAIAGGDMNEALELLSPGALVYIVDDTFLNAGPIDGGGGTRSISGGGITGIVIGSIAALMLVGALATRRQPAKETEELAAAPAQVDRDLEGLGEGFAVPPAKLDYKQGKDAMVDNDDDIAPMSDDASSAGSSGWSSSAGVSSLNTGSQDGFSPGRLAKATGAIVTPPKVSEKTKDGRVGPAPPAKTITRADLDSAIEAGDWAAVGATAALLAAASDSQSSSSKSAGADLSGAQSHAESYDSSQEAARAAELDHLVESGDWEGVVLAAAKFEAAESRSGSDSRTDDGSPGNSKRQEYRAEVEELVRRVVPEEIENVDEMMTQFRGREDELIETLRTMEERAVAQKARQGAQKQAKVQAKRKTPEERAADVSALLAPGAAASSARSLGTGQVTTPAQPVSTSLGSGKVEGTAKSRSLGTGTILDETPKQKSNRELRQSALEKAIEAGDWEAVGEAATMLSESSVASSVETDEINRLADGISSQGSVGSRGNLSQKAEELEELIERGDWAGVVSAAGKGKSSKPETKEQQDEARRQRRLKARQEEEDALAQAEIWEAIAEQTKQDAAGQSSGQAAASAAADWAIGRSLQALNQADDEEGKESSSRKKDKTKGDEKEV